jgi:Fic family protein
VCAWVHAEWVRIHPFANGNGRTARHWVNSIALRYAIPASAVPASRGYAIACERAMVGDRGPTVALFHDRLANFGTNRIAIN